jgi:hypothetical protein
MDFIRKILGLVCVWGAFFAVAPCNVCVADESMTVPVTLVETLQPTFAWTAPKESAVTYDFIVCLAVKESHGFWIPGKKAYYRGGLKTTTHTLAQPLLPNTMYVWSVRTRTAGKISSWAAYSDSNPSLFRKGRKQYNILCPFKTPDK